MPEFVVVLAEPKFAGNIGFIARSMSNFGLCNLVLHNPCELADDAFRFAKHAREIVENAKIVDSFEKAVEGLDLVIGTTGIPSENEKKFLRHPMSPKEFAEHVLDKDGKVGLVFGREDIGLYNEELALCDIMVTIPTVDEYPIMNISHAATILFYELCSDGGAVKKQMAGAKEKETLNELFSELLDDTNYPEHKKVKTKVMFRRIVGRADLSKWEFHTLAGVVSRASKSIKMKKN